MNVLLVSQCSGNALTETRRILDQFAERRGERTWQTPITQAGLDTLRRLLRKRARKNTAVACHWIRGRDHSELLWIVGDASRFGVQGAVPTNTTQRDVLRRADENDWHSGEDIRLLSGLAALMHDLGKACEAFQRRLRGKLSERNRYRHEWISLRLFEAFVSEDDDNGWLTRLADGGGVERWLEHLRRDGLDDAAAPPFGRLPPLAAAVGWLIVSHHRLPTKPRDRNTGPLAVDGYVLSNLPGVIAAEWNEPEGGGTPEEIQPYWRFKHRLPIATDRWRERAGGLARRLLERLSRHAQPMLDEPYVMHLARLSLMLADHYYSRLQDPHHRVRGEPGYPLYANTVRKTGALNQPLDEHLLGVERHSGAITRALPTLHSHLPRLARHKGFRKRSADTHFRWQDRAFDLAQSLRDRSAAQGFFGVNMASTGCGKTLANGRILYALGDPQQGARFSVALGLRTLTLQTGEVYRQRLSLGADELAIRVGGSASRALFEHYARQAEAQGSASAQQLIEEDGHVTFEGNFDEHPVLRRLKDEPGAQALIAAPILVCTVDHLVPATESLRGGRQIVPMLRLMSSDLVLDEVDDFGIDDLPAITRLVHWAGLLGARVLLSSATLAPALVRGLFDAYRAGRDLYQRNRGEPGKPVDICCAWFDERDRQHSDCADGDVFAEAHQRFAERRAQRLATAMVRRRATIQPLAGLGRSREDIRRHFAERLPGFAAELHERHHSVDPHSGKRVSFGLIRLANIDPLVDTALALFRLGAPEGQRIHLCVYHSRHPLLIRSAIEQRLDRALDRHDANAVFQIPEIRHRLDTAPERDQLFIVLGSPVTEVGRDHDYDWAVVEPSSMRSIIQLAGRVRRHRDEPCEAPNLLLLGTNLRHLEDTRALAFCRPGYETAEAWRFDSHELHALLREDEYRTIDARPRILERPLLQPRSSLVDLEHHRLRCTMIAPERPEGAASSPVESGLSPRARRREARKRATPPLGAYTWYVQPRVHLTGLMAQYQPFRHQTQAQTALVLLPDESGEASVLHRIYEKDRARGKLYVPVEYSQLERVDLAEQTGPRIQSWGETDFMAALADLADAMELPLAEVAVRFGTVAVADNERGWRYHATLGFQTRK